MVKMANDPNVVDPMKLESESERPHGLSDIDYAARFTKDKHFDKHGEDLGEIRNWKRPAGSAE
jgi:phosphoketolase